MDAAHQGKYTNADLPKGCQDKYLWRHVFIPTVYTYFAACPDPWSQNDNLVVGKLQLVWNKSFEDEPCVRHTILPSKAVFSVAAQRTCEWCAAFGSTALSFLNAFFTTNPGFDTNEARVAFSTHQLQFFRFLYEFAEGDNKNVRSTPRRLRTDHDLQVRHSAAYFSLRSSCKHLPIILFPLPEPSTSQDSMITGVRPEVHSHLLLLL